MDSNSTHNTLRTKDFKCSFGQHRNHDVIWTKFPYSAHNLQLLKTHFNPKWSATKKCWYVKDCLENRLKLNLPPKNIGKSALQKIHPNNQEAYRNFINILSLKGYSKHTVRTYSVEFAQLLYLLQHHKVNDLNAEKLQSYFLYCINDLQLSENYIHSRMNAIKFYFEKVLHRPKLFLDIPRPKKPLLLPKSLNIKEIEKIIACTENLKHKLIIKLCYGMGLRVSEIVNIKIEDIDSTDMRVLISRAKGKKDRYVNLPESILYELREYYKEYRPQKYLFEGQNGRQYSIRSAQSVFKNAMNKAGIRKKVGIHSLRHSYATHLLEYGTDISNIQKLLGHNHISTTLNYTKITDKDLSKVKSPLDFMR